MGIKHIRNNDININLPHISEPGSSRHPTGETLFEEKNTLLSICFKRSIFDEIGNGISFVLIANTEKEHANNSYCGISQEYFYRKILEKHRMGNRPIHRCTETAMKYGNALANKGMADHSMEVMI